MERLSEEIQKLLVDFYKIMGTKISVCDGEGEELSYYPVRYSKLCEYLRSHEKMEEKCHECDKAAVRRCLETHSPYISTCHAGLIECWIPLFIENTILGYLVMGQIKSEKTDEEEVVKILTENGMDEKEVRAKLAAMQTVSEEDIKAAAHVLQACVGYEHLKHFVEESKISQKEKIVSFINENLTANLSTDILERKLKVSRVELYSLFSQWFGTTPAEFVKKRRLNYAKKLLTDTDKPINKIAEECGIGDYNYFSKLFHKEFKMTPRECRKQSSN